jgi:hypothetical protein
MINSNKLIDEKVLILANDFVQEDTFAIICMVSEEQMLLKLVDTLVLNNISYAKVVASPRNINVNMINCNITSSEYLSCAAIWIPVEKFNKSLPFDTSWWRGGGAAIIELLLSSE